MAAATLKVLMILTSQATMGAGGAPTGAWYEEVATPYYVLQDAGVQVDIVSIKGGKAPIDPRSLKTAGQNPASVERFQNDPATLNKLNHTPAVSQASDKGYAAVFLPGGHGTMWDEADNPALTKLVSQAWRDGKVVASVCHGAAGLIGTTDSNGKPIVQGRRVNSFTNAEEKGATVPYLLETRLHELGAKYESGPNFQPYAVQDGKLITGQNPASSEKVARLILNEIKKTGTLAVH
ncbi:type 1 glutamine amidotransferase domain-containing protein [Neisseria perflava]|uniref:type 1 glutamine amidotransferase domain-containing protein n=1 Tax=Neisseria perflava TaxID=33053 RepID=UPI0020A0D2F0|nr:type 1 glutamine amidotransferase domain-containing protein [Neisseria perflava]MCP1660985.1 putative intracellular protease/amidase [Neisseria perflava]MCP1772994.1 putative intracellular protease/amidase [Neisseria perflava]